MGGVVEQILSLFQFYLQFLEDRIEPRTYRFKDPIRQVFDDVGAGSFVVLDITWNLDDYFLQLRRTHPRDDYHLSTQSLKSVYAGWIMSKKDFPDKENLKQGLAWAKDLGVFDFYVDAARQRRFEGCAVPDLDLTRTGSKIILDQGEFEKCTHPVDKRKTEDFKP